MTTRRQFARFAAGAALGGLGFASHRSTLAANPLPNAPVVVELFTSQGCSSCPPADRLLGELARRPDVIALSFHVDYWDYIGWKDPFATAATTARQHSYAQALRQRYVYTPEMVFNGAAHDPGTNPARVYKMLRQAAERAGARCNPVLDALSGGRGLVELPRMSGVPLSDIWLLSVDPRHVTPVGRGENRGTTLTNFNVVRSIEKLATWTGEATRLTVPADKLAPGAAMVVLVQTTEHGPILGAARLDRLATN
ncbi:MAG: DUF1223 domain-containing protein [Alphaproteobacteria bacterium]|nr:DUF1223 domain-containing protein [Alphaproteobacteria bacterium]MCW5741164.1 DUF1223 domain-containing protein [Alphaproteobacteria bacterium]